MLYRETHILLEELAEAVIDGTRKQYVESISTAPLLIIDDFGMRKLPQTAAEDLLEIIMRRYERASTLLTSNRPVEDWGKLLGDAAAVGAMLDRLLHHATCSTAARVVGAPRPPSSRDEAVPYRVHERKAQMQKRRGNAGGHGKPGKPHYGFPRFPPPLGNRPEAIPTFPPRRRRFPIQDRTGNRQSAK